MWIHFKDLEVNDRMNFTFLEKKKKYILDVQIYSTYLHTYMHIYRTNSQAQTYFRVEIVRLQCTTCIVRSESVSSFPSLGSDDQLREAQLGNVQGVQVKPSQGMLRK